ncbi:MAG: MFS transporter, partial [Candidatus Thorarchaeota archaeon]|nr:MFS transporter [Candidatus Thorarchaeota archaeon]NIW50800.1 MFS transporter [Candidatus Korarchaeota archaeon]
GVSRSLVILSLLISSCVFFVSLTRGFWLIRATEVIGLSSYQWGVVMLISGAINVSLSIPAGRLVDKYIKKWVAGITLILGALPTFLFLKVTSFNQIIILAAVITMVNIFINPAFQTLFANMTPRRQRGRIMAFFGPGGLRLLQGAWGNGIVGMLTQTSGSFLSGYLYRVSISLPWILLSASMIVLGILFIALVQEPEKAEF